MFDGKCVLTVPLPTWEFGAVWAGQKAPDTGTVLWETKFQWSADRFRQALRTVRSRPPAASSAFDVYQRSDALTYVREPCELVDVRARFFLHVYTASSEIGGDDPADEGPRFHNLDFDFGERGAMFDGKCVAVAPLPDEPITRTRTGQFLRGPGREEGREAWAVDLASR